MLTYIRVGQNPTSGTLSISRRKAIYALCQQYDILIIEDDPYWYLQFPSSLPPNRTADYSSNSHQFSEWKSSGFEFLDSLVPSYLNFDPDGRVIRLDTFSKTVAPGCRLGWITTQPGLAERLLRTTEATTQQPSGFVQSMISELMLGPHGNSDKSGGWGTKGFVRWLEGLRGNYERRMNLMCDILESGNHLVSESAQHGNEWSLVSKHALFTLNRPMGGMFIWIHVNYAAHPLYGKYSNMILAQACWVHLTTEKFLVLVAPGIIFSPTADIARTEGWEYYRACFAAVNDDVIARASDGFVSGIRSFWEITDIDEILKLASKLDMRGFQLDLEI
jgi:DNA-binding transcriptional MocR family regulator